MASILKVDTIQDQSGNNIINENADTITIGASGDTVNIVGTLQNGGTNFLQGITMSQAWRLSADTNSGTNTDVTTNWEEVDDTIYGSIGTGLTESSGIFSFPQTGIYLLDYVMFTLTTGSEATMRLYLQATEDNSNYSQIAHIQHGNEGARTNQGSQNYIFDITDISNQKFKFTTVSFSAGSVLRGATATTLTGFTVIRLGDT